MSIDNFWSSNKYLLNMNISVCYESNGPCEIDGAVIFDNDMVQKEMCNWKMNFPVAGRKRNFEFHNERKRKRSDSVL